MAPVARPRWEVSYTFRDNNDKTSAVNVYFPEALDYAGVLAAANSLAVDMQDVSNASIIGWRISRSVVENAAPAAPPESEVERKLRIPLGTVEFENASSMEVPSPVFSLEQPGTDVVASGNLLLVQLVNSLTNGGLGGGNGITTILGEDITRAGVATIVHRTRKARR